MTAEADTRRPELLEPPTERLEPGDTLEAANVAAGTGAAADTAGAADRRAGAANRRTGSANRGAGAADRGAGAGRPPESWPPTGELAGDTDRRSGSANRGAGAADRGTGDADRTAIAGRRTGRRNHSLNGLSLFLRFLRLSNSVNGEISLKFHFLANV